MSARKGEFAPLITQQGVRLFRIERALRGQVGLRFSDLLSICEASPATVKRDLQMLRDDYDAPLSWSAEGGYSLTSDWPGLAPLLQTEIERA